MIHVTCLMTTAERLELIKQVGEEITTEEELKDLLDSGEKLIAYDGFEPSGQIHIAQGLLRAININKMTKAGVKFKMLVADWHAMANNKMGGDLDKIQTVARYFIEVWKACGMDMDNIEFVWASDLVKNPDYWKLVIQVGRTNVLKRFIRTAEMMGRAESLDALTGANIIYSCMQVADIFMLDAKITQLGMDQRKVNMLAREVGLQLDPPAGGWKPVVVSHHMLMGLSKPQGLPEGSRTDSPGVAETDDKLTRTIQLKMSKSNPDSAIFMTDSKEDIERKINKAYCPEGVVEGNPILEYCRYIIFPFLLTPGVEERSGKTPGVSFVITRPEKFGGTVSFTSYSDLEKAFINKEIHPQDLKLATISSIDRQIQPVRKYFEENENAKQLLQKVQSFQVTR